MLNIGFVATLALFLFALITWGVRHLPAERWQMLAAVPIAKAADGSWLGLNLTFYGFFSASGTTFGCLMLLLLLASVGLPIYVSCALIGFVLLVCVPSSRLIAGMVERKRNTFTIAGAAFTATILLPPLVIAASAAARQKFSIPVLPVFAAAINAYVLAEAIGRLACISFGCCYGLPLRDARPWLAQLFRRHSLILKGSNKKASYASGFSGEPLIPVQALTSALFAMGGVAGIALFLAERYRVAALIPLLTSYGWRACSEWLRADYRGASKVSPYQIMTIISLVYLAVAIVLVPDAGGIKPDLIAAFRQMSSAWVLVLSQLLWMLLFLYYGRSRVTSSVLSFHVVADRI
jgi:hypothetical protein